jgi:hypothetical protein
VLVMNTIRWCFVSLSVFFLIVSFDYLLAASGWWVTYWIVCVILNVIAAWESLRGFSPNTRR